jgi:hypothetical protein
MILSRSFLFRIRNFSEKVVEKIVTCASFTVTFFLKVVLVYETMWSQHVTDDNVIRRMLDNEGYKHTEYLIRSGFAREQLLYERASVLHLNV